MRKKHSYMYTVTTKLLLSKERDLTPASKSNRSAFLVPVKGVRQILCLQAFPMLLRVKV